MGVMGPDVFDNRPTVVESAVTDQSACDKLPKRSLGGQWCGCAGPGLGRAPGWSSEGKTPLFHQSRELMYLLAWRLLVSCRVGVLGLPLPLGASPCGLPICLDKIPRSGAGEQPGSSRGRNAIKMLFKRVLPSLLLLAFPPAPTKKLILEIEWTERTVNKNWEPHSIKSLGRK